MFRLVYSIIYLAIFTSSEFLLVGSTSVLVSFNLYVYLKKDVNFHGRPHVSLCLSAKLLYVDEEKFMKVITEKEIEKGSFWIWYFT